MPLSFPVPAARLSLAVDASESHLGGILQQWERGGWRPLAFFSKKLAAAQAKYSAFDRELLAAYMAVRHFRFVLEGRQFVLFTDHRPLVAAIKRVSPPWSARQQRHLAYVSEFTTDLQHLPGTANVVADALSRPPSVSFAPVTSVAAAPATVPSDQLAAAQADCPDVQRLVTAPSLRVISKNIDGHRLLGDVSSGSFRPLIPTSFRRRIFDSLHGLGHPGMRASRRLISSRFCWRGLAKDVSGWARECVAC